MITAIMVDGSFYLKRAFSLFGEKSPETRARELEEYCYRHLKHKSEKRELYRIFYYDCPPSEKNVYNPITQKSEDLRKTPQFAWRVAFLEELKKRRKVALRMGELNDTNAAYIIKPDKVKELFKGKITVNDLSKDDLKIDMQQKGVDMKIGLDIASLAYKRLVNQIILIAGDSDFVPAAKHARREGVDFILDPMWHPIKPNLYEHIDGLENKTPKPGTKKDHLRNPEKRTVQEQENKNK